MKEVKEPVEAQVAKQTEEKKKSTRRRKRNNTQQKQVVKPVEITVDDYENILAENLNDAKEQKAESKDYIYKETEYTHVHNSYNFARSSKLTTNDEIEKETIRVAKHEFKNIDDDCKFTVEINTYYIGFMNLGDFFKCKIELFVDRLNSLFKSK